MDRRSRLAQDPGGWRQRVIIDRFHDATPPDQCDRGRGGAVNGAGGERLRRHPAGISSGRTRGRHEPRRPSDRWQHCRSDFVRGHTAHTHADQDGLRSVLREAGCCGHRDSRRGGRWRARECLRLRQGRTRQPAVPGACYSRGPRPEVLSIRATCVRRPGGSARRNREQRPDAAQHPRSGAGEPGG
jgi:hypothetical protein